MDSNDMDTTAVEQRENSALLFWNKFTNPTRKALADAATEHWESLNVDAGGDDFQKEIAVLMVQRDILKDTLDLAHTSGDEVRISAAQQMFDEQQALLDEKFRDSTASAEMTAGMVGLFADFLPLALQEANVTGMSSLFRTGMHFNVTTGEDRTDVVPVVSPSVKQNGSKERAPRNAERATKTCDLIVVYEQGNDTPIAEIKRGDYGRSALVGATIFLSEKAGRPHGCTLVDGKYEMPDASVQLTNMPWVRTTNGSVSGQTDQVAELAMVTRLVVKGYNSGDLEFQIDPVGDEGISMVGSDGMPYRTKSIRDNKNLKLVD